MRPEFNPLHALLAEAIGSNLTAGRDRWHSKDLDLLQRAFERMGKSEVPKPGTLIRWVPVASGDIGIVMGSSPLHITGTDISMPFYGRNLDTLIGWYRENDEGLELRLSACPFWAVEPISESVNPPPQCVETLRDLIRRYQEPVDLKPGDKCTWKPDMKNRRQTGVFVFLRSIAPYLDEERRSKTLELDYIINCEVLVDIGGEPLSYCLDKNRLMPA